MTDKAAGARTIETKITEHQDGVTAELPIDGWLMDLGSKSNVASVRVSKRDPGGRWAQLPKAHGELLPPFDVDVHTIYEAFGDGEYRFAPMGQGGRPLTAAGTAARIETVLGYGDGKKPKTSGPRESAADPEAFMEKMFEQKRREYLWDQIDRRMGPSDNGPARDPDADLERLLKLAAVLRGGNDGMASVLAAMISSNTQMMTALLTRSLNPPEPAEKMLDMVTKVMDLTEKIRPSDGFPADMDWKQMLMMAFFGQMQPGGAIRDFLTVKAAATVTQAPPPAIPVATSTAPRPSVPPAPASAQTTDPNVGRIEAAHELLRSSLWPLIVSAARRDSKEYELYLGLMDEQLPHFVDQWISIPFEASFPFIESVQAGATQDETIMAWLRKLYDYALHATTDEAQPTPGG